MNKFWGEVRANLASQKAVVIFLVFLFIFADIVCENFIGIIYNQQTPAQSFWLFLGFVLLQILFAPIQSGLSDRYGRKKSLIVSLSFSLLSLVLLYVFSIEIKYFSLLIVVTILKGGVGNTLPISLAVIADTHDKNYRMLFAISTAAYALAYLILASIGNSMAPFVLSVKINPYLVLFFVVIVVFCIFFLRDSRDNDLKIVRSTDSHTILQVFKHESKLLIEDLKHSPNRKALAAFFLWETSLYSILISQVDFQINKATHIAESMMHGYLLGVFILLFCSKFKDSQIITLGYFTSFLSLVPYFLLFKIIVEDQTFLLRICYFFHALGNAFLSPALLSMLAKERKPHEQGRIYGLADSIDTLGYLCAAIAIMAYNALNLKIIYLISFSFLVFAISWMYYNRFQNIKA